MTLSATLLLPAVLGGCSKLATIHLDESDQVTIPQGTLLDQLIGNLGFSGFSAMDITADTELQNQGVEPGDVKDVVLTDFELEALDPAGSDLSFIDSMQVYATAPELPKVLLASQTSFPAGQATVSFQVEDVDLTDYVTSQSLTITTDVSGHPPDQDTMVEGRFGLDVGVTAKGALRKR